MNRRTATDSKKSLDGIRAAGETRRMNETRSSHFERRDRARNMQRFYRLTVTHDPFGTVLLVREWGRIGVFSREWAEAKPNVAEARRGYVPVVDRWQLSTPAAGSGSPPPEASRIWS